MEDIWQEGTMLSQPAQQPHITCYLGSHLKSWKL